MCGRLLAGGITAAWMVIGKPGPAGGAVWLQVTKLGAARATSGPQSPFYALVLGTGARSDDPAQSPDDPGLHMSLGGALAILGREEEAVREGERAAKLAPTDGSALKYLASIHARLGHPEPAIDALEKLLKVPYRITPGWLRVDPFFDPLRGNPRFEKLAAGKP